MGSEKTYTVDHFFGLNESDIGETEFKQGEATICENFYITDGYNLRSRPGIRRWVQKNERAVYNTYRHFWSGYIGETKCLVAFGLRPGEPYITVFSEHGTSTVVTNANVTHVVQNGKRLCAVAEDMQDPSIVRMFYVDYRQGEDGAWNIQLEEAEAYIPLIFSGAEPTGGGTAMENLNVLTDKFRLGFFGKESVKAFTLLPSVSAVLSIDIGGVKNTPENLGSFDTETKVFTFNEAPADQSEIVFICAMESTELAQARQKFLRMRHTEYFGTVESRVFFYGDGTNVCYYTSEPAFAYDNGYGSKIADGAQIQDGTEKPVGLYLPAANEIAVDFSDSPITAMTRDYTRMLVFKPDGVDAISYSSMTLADGKVIAGFYRHTVNREFGHDAMGQVVLVNNYPRTFTHNSLYEWRVSTAYRDERFAKCVSQKIAKTLARVDPRKVVVCDDERTKTYYAFMNDEDGTVIVNRYDLDAWSIYKSRLTKNVTHAFTAFDQVIFAAGGELFTFDSEATFDDNEEIGGALVPFESRWEGGYYAFGADFLRKYSSLIWVSVKPEALSQLEITVKTDRRDDYISKIVGTNLLDFAKIDFSNFSFLTNKAPKMQRIKLKVKKFVYYKMIFKVTKPGARATVLGYDQQVRFSSQVK